MQALTGRSGLKPAKTQTPGHCQTRCVITAATPAYEVRICTNKACAKQGSESILKLGQSLMLEDVDVCEGGCLGLCGSGPNVCVYPEGKVIKGMQTITDFTTLCEEEFGVTVPESAIKATNLRIEGNLLIEQGDIDGGIVKYSEAIDLKPEIGLHFLYSNRSSARLRNRDVAGALEDARASVAQDPTWITGHIRVIDACYAAGDRDGAVEAFYDCLGANPDFDKDEDYFAIAQALGIE